MLFISVLGCGDDDGVTNPASLELVLVDAAVKSDGQSIDGETIRVGRNTEGVLRFEAHLSDHQNNPALGYEVRVEYEIPGMRMMYRRGTLMLHDDGMHGDLVPGDGLYCYEDTSGEYGCHRSDAEPGEYHYDFCGVDHDGHESNRMRRTVTLVR